MIVGLICILEFRVVRVEAIFALPERAAEGAPILFGAAVTFPHAFDEGVGGDREGVGLVCVC